MTRVLVRSFGCSLNIADGEVIAGCLKEAGFKLVEQVGEADIVICNTCAVKGPTEDSMISALKAIPAGKKVVVAGCLPLINFRRLVREVRFDGAVGPALGFDIVEVVRRVEAGEKVSFLNSTAKPPLSLPRVARSSVIWILPIAYGCLGNCSYCCVRLARGILRSYSITEVVREVERAVSKGYKEIWLTAQDTGCYGQDLGVDLADLVRAVTAVEGNFYVRIGMMGPDRALQILDELIDAFSNEKVFKFLHIPVQSGDDEVLRSMNRRYQVDEFREVVRKFRRTFPRMTIMTDVICGFPTETEEAFERTIELIEEVKPDVVNVSRYCPRPGTPAAMMKPLPSQIVKTRSRVITRIVREIAFERNREWISWKGEILVDEPGKPGTWMGRNFAYKPIVVRSERELLGSRLEVRVIDVRPSWLLAEMA